MSDIRESEVGDQETPVENLLVVDQDALDSVEPEPRSEGKAPLSVDVRNLWVRYGKTTAVRGIDLQIPRGEVFGFIGPNGAGKSSTIKVLATLLRNFDGVARVCGYDVRRDPTAVRERMGYVPDFFGVYEDLTSREYLHFFAAAYRIDRRKRDSIVSDVLELTDLTNKIDAQVDTLSRGMKQRLSLARVLLHDPELLLLDEPTSGLDPRARIEVRELLKALTEMGKTILISSHIVHELAHLCTRIGIIEAGEMVAHGSLQDIYQQLSLFICSLPTRHRNSSTESGRFPASKKSKSRSTASRCGCMKMSLRSKTCTTPSVSRAPGFACSSRKRWTWKRPS